MPDSFHFHQLQEEGGSGSGFGFGVDVGKKNTVLDVIAVVDQDYQFYLEV